MSKVHTSKSSPLPTEATVVVAPTAPAKPKVVALRGGPAISTVKMGPNVYHVQAPHNILWWNIVTAKLAASDDGTAAVTDLLEHMPGTMIRYLVARGYLIGQ
jgi:hypothetical protein